MRSVAKIETGVALPQPEGADDHGECISLQDIVMLVVDYGQSATGRPPEEL